MNKTFVLAVLPKDSEEDENYCEYARGNLETISEELSNMKRKDEYLFDIREE